MNENVGMCKIKHTLKPEELGLKPLSIVYHDFLLTFSVPLSVALKAEYEC